MTVESTNGNEPFLSIYCSPGFLNWLEQQNVSVAITTYQTGNLFLLGRSLDGELTIAEKYFRRSMGLCSSNQRLWMSSEYQIWRFEDVSEGMASQQSGVDRLYVPQAAYTTGDLDTHDVAVNQNGDVVFINTRCSCLATISERKSFRPLWFPPFITSLAPEDRCHLNGLAMEAGRPRFVTAFAKTDTPEGWRQHRQNGGCLIDVESSEVICEGLSVPHSPRIYRDQLWVLNSGTGHFGAIDLPSGQFHPLTLGAGYLRGLSFTGNYGVVGVSSPRRGKAFEGLHLQEELERNGIAPACGLHVIDLETFEITEWLRFEGRVTEIYDVVLLPNTKCPNLIGVEGSEIRKHLTIEKASNKDLDTP